MSAGRYAVYWAPEADDPLWAAGCAWLGRDPASEATGTPPPERHAPWRYGFHATLKAPMALAEGHRPDDLRAALQAVLRDHRPFALPPLAVGQLHDFVALRPLAPCPPLQALADDCVRRLDPLRRTGTPRAAEGLDDEQRALLERWGYPHVLQRWRFHLTLSDALADDASRARVQTEAERAFAAALRQPRGVASVAVFVEAAPGQPLRLAWRLPLQGG